MATITGSFTVYVVEDGKPGADGKPAESTFVRTSAQVLAMSADNVQLTPLHLEAVHRVGADEQLVEARFFVRYMNGESMVDEDSLDVGTSTDFTWYPKIYGNVDSLVFWATNAGTGKKWKTAEVTIPLSRANPVPFPRWEAWDAGLTYRNGEYLLHDGVVYMWRYPEAGNSKLNPKQDMADNPNATHWMAYQNYPVLATQALFAPFALLGGAVAWEQVEDVDGKPVHAFAKMFSQTGRDGTADYRKFDPTKDADDTSQAWKPNVCIDWKKGRVYMEDAVVRGTVYADKGKIGGFELTDSSMTANVISGGLSNSRFALYGSGLLFEQWEQNGSGGTKKERRYVAIGDSLPASTGINDMVTGVMRLSLRDDRGHGYAWGGRTQMEAGALMVKVSGGKSQCALYIRTDNQGINETRKGTTGVKLDTNDTAIDFIGGINTNGATIFGGGYKDYGLTTAVGMGSVWNDATGKFGSADWYFVNGILTNIVRK